MSNHRGDMAWQAGASRQEVTCWEEGIHLFGWGIPSNIALGTATPMFARALVLDNGTTPIALVLVDVGTITYTLRRFALQALRENYPACPIEDEHILLTATHTHSGPSGYSEYLFYGFSGPGLSRHIVDTYAQGIAKAIDEAWRLREPATLRVGSEDLPLNVPVAFNRSLRPFHRNQETAGSPAKTSEEATHRLMTVLRADRLSDGTPLGVFSWFATHATSVHSDNTKIHGDNRGLAALDFEKQLRQEYGREVVTGFAQEAAGDTTPNFRWNPKRKLVIGAFDEDHDSAQFVANALRRLAYRITKNDDQLRPLSDQAGGLLRYVELPGFRFEAPEAHGQEVELGDAVMGLGFVQGTKEGPGPLHGLRYLARRATSYLRDAKQGAGMELRPNQGNKLPFLDTGRGMRGKAFGLIPVIRPNIPAAIDSTVRTYKYYVATGAVDDHAWTPTVLPFQVLQIGELWLAAVPGEATTMAGQRIREALGRILKQSESSADQQLPQVVVAAYSNDYAAYITTYEEYFEQWYEGASTMFGPYTHSATRHILERLSEALRTGSAPELPISAPPTFEDRLFTQRDYRSKPSAVRGYKFSRTSSQP